MRYLLALLCLLPLTTMAHPLSHTKWIEESASRCPTSIFFGVEKYVFINTCHSDRNDNVIEKGLFVISEQVITLTQRRAIAFDGFVYIPFDITDLTIRELTGTELVLRIGELTINYRRIAPNTTIRSTQLRKPAKPGLDPS